MTNQDHMSQFVVIKYPERLTRGLRLAVGEGTWINAAGGITLGNDVLIAPYVVIHSSNHNFDRTDIPINQQGNTNESVHIGNDVWIGAHATILPGATIGDHCVIGAGSVVAGNATIPEWAVAVGNPARVIRFRDTAINDLFIDLLDAGKDYGYALGFAKLQLHRRKTHDTTEADAHCPQCNRAIHDSDPERHDYKCPDCGCDWWMHRVKTVKRQDG
ncbi:MAG: acyltransferase [Candidatus Babeliales bacterium]|jgi:maltose O-acetyltransferase